MRLGGPAHEIMTKTVHKTLPEVEGAQGVGGYWGTGGGGGRSNSTSSSTSASPSYSSVPNTRAIVDHVLFSSRMSFPPKYEFLDTVTG